MFKSRTERIKDSYRTAEDRLTETHDPHNVSNDEMFGLLGIQVEKR